MAGAGILACSGMGSDLLHRLADDLRRHVIGDLYLADLDGQNEMNGSGYRLLVHGEPGHDFLAPAAQMRQRPVSLDGGRNPFRSLRRAETAIAGYGRSSHHSPGNGLAVQKLGVISGSLQGVADGMTEVKNTAQIGFLFVGGDHSGLYTNGIDNDPLQRPGIPPENLLCLPVHEVKKQAIADDPALE